MTLGVDNHDGTIVAEVEASRGGYHGVESAIHQFFLEVGNEVHGIVLEALSLGLGSTKTGADKDMKIGFQHDTVPFDIYRLPRRVFFV
jgi:hypothetical protein